MFLCTIGTLIRTTDTKTTPGHVTLRAGLIGGGSLKNFTNINVGHTAAEVLRTLKAGVGATNMEVTHDSFDIPRTSTGGNLVEALQSDSTAKIIDCSSNYRTASSGKARSIHQISMIFLNRELIINGTRNTDTSRITKTNVKIRSKNRRRSGSRTSTFILNQQFQRAVGLNSTTFADNRQLHIRATLWSGEGRSKVVFQPAAGKKITKKTRFPIGTIFRIIGRQITVTREIYFQFVINVLIAVILIPDQAITTEGERRDRNSSANAIGKTTSGQTFTSIRLQRQAESGDNTITRIVNPTTLTVSCRPNSNIHPGNLIPR